jgi:RNA polymerase sigma-70 factor (family 1)
LTKQEFKYCFDAYFDAIRNYVYYRSGDVDLATDIAQDVLMKLWEKQVDFEESRTKSLLYKMASDAFVSQVRKNQVSDKYLGSIELSFNDQDPHKELQYTELKARYQKVLAELTENQREVFLMNRSEELTYKEIAERLGLSVKAVEKRMSLAIKTLKQKLL